MKKGEIRWIIIEKGSIKYKIKGKVAPNHLVCIGSPNRLRPVVEPIYAMEVVNSSPKSTYYTFKSNTAALNSPHIKRIPEGTP